MASNDNVFGVPAGLKHSWAWNPGRSLPPRLQSDKHHIFRQIDSNQPIRFIKDFVAKEPETSA